MEYKIVDYVKNLLPRIDKTDVQEDIHVTLGEIDNVVIPSLSTAAAYFRTTKLASADNLDLSDEFYRAFDLQGSAKAPNFIVELDKRMPMIRANLVYLQQQVENLFERDIINEGLTAKKAVLVRAVEHISFISRFTSDLLNYVYANEAIKLDMKTEESMQLAPAVLKQVLAHFKSYVKLVSSYGIANDKFRKIVLEVPDVAISTRSSSAISGMYKESDLDPFSTAYISGFYGSPIFHFRMVIAEWQAGRYKSNKDKKKALELRILHLKTATAQKPNPKLEHEIIYTQSRVDKIERYLREVEADLVEQE